jgi:hypothetical protein
MRQFSSLDVFAAFLRTEMTSAIGDAFMKAQAHKAGRAIVEEAKSAIGTYRYGWPRLKEATVARKGGRDTPLLETGKYRASISYSVEEIRNGYQTVVGSTSPLAPYFELGTSRMPPRPVLTGAVVRVAPNFAKGFGSSAVQALTGRAGLQPD